MITVAPPTLPMVPKSLAKPSILLKLTCSSLQQRRGSKQKNVGSSKKWNIPLEEKQMPLKARSVVVYVYLRTEAMIKVIAGTEFCIAEAKVGDA